MNILWLKSNLLNNYKTNEKWIKLNLTMNNDYNVHTTISNNLNYKI